MSNSEAPPFDLVRMDLSGHPVLVIYGELDVLTTPRLHAALEQLTEEAPDAVLLDLANVTFLDSTALGALVVAHRHLSDHGGELRLVAVPASVAKTFEITGLTERFHIYADTEAAAVGKPTDNS